MRIPPQVALAAVVLALGPLLIAAPGLAGSGVSGWMLQLGRGAGIAGMTCFLLAAILSVRIPGLDPWLGGLTAVWRLHHLLGAAAFLLLMAHPLLLGLSAADAGGAVRHAQPVSPYHVGAKYRQALAVNLGDGAGTRLLKYQYSFDDDNLQYTWNDRNQ